MPEHGNVEAPDGQRRLGKNQPAALVIEALGR
jgi:hypothetical protein